MAGDPTNPFNDQLSKLNGVNFGQTQVLASSNSAQIANNQVTISSPDSLSAAGTITVTNYTGSPKGDTPIGGYIPPTFGEINISGQGDFKIIGISAHGLLLYKILYPQLSLMYLEAFPQGLTAYVLSPRGFTDQTGVSFPVTFGYNPQDYVVCFAEGTRLATPKGHVLVEDLASGDLVCTASGEARPVRWVGQMTVRPKVHSNPHEVNPIRIRAHAFTANVPARDLRVSPGHAIYVDGVLVPAGQLVNGATIVQEAVDSIRYFHVELESHDLLLAEGLACESYLDDGNRASFASAGHVFAFNGRLDPKVWEHACAPLVAAGPQLADIRQRLHARAEELGWVRSEEAALTVAVDGIAIAPVHRAGNRHWFLLPSASEVTLRSCSGVLAELVPGLTDSRRLGVAVSALRLNGAPLPLDDAGLGTGFYPVEAHGEQRWRWTDGTGVIALGRDEPVMLEVEVLMAAPSWIEPAAALRCVA